MIALLALALAGAAENEENTFALVFQGLEWATPDLRFEVGDGPVATVLSWPITPFSASVCRFSDCRLHLVAEPYVEPQLRLGSGDTRLLVGSQTVFMGRKRGMGIAFDGAAVHEAESWGWAAGGGLIWGGGAERLIRGRFGLRSRYISVGEAARVDLSLDIVAPIALRGWGRLFRRQDIGEAADFCPPDDVIEEPFDDRRYDYPDDPYDPPGCDPYGCSPGMCGEVEDGCGGIMFCGDCGHELLPICDPVGCMPGMCGVVSDGCGGTMSCGPCDDEVLLPACDPVGCMPGMCGVMSNGCGGTMFCGACEPDPVECVPLTCDPGVCGVLPDGCGGTLDCGACGWECAPMDCQPGTCGPQPDGCGGTNDCGPCTP